MTNDSFKKLMESRTELHRQLEPLSATTKAVQADSGFQRLIADMNRSQELARAALGPVEELRRSGLLDITSQLGAEARHIQKVMAQIDKQFQLPALAEATKLLQQQIDCSGLATVMQRSQTPFSEIRRALEAMRTPWLDMENEVRSLISFAELQGIGHALRTLPAFDTTLAARLRVGLGDWREKIKWPEVIFTDPLARTDFYVARGLDPALTAAFPASAFEQSITIAGIKGTPPALIEPYAFEPEGYEDEEEGFARTNAAHDLLQRFESQLRKFIDEQMTAAFGEHWVTHQIPGTMRQGMEGEAAERGGQRRARTAPDRLCGLHRLRNPDHEEG